MSNKDDCISRRAAIDALDEQIEQCNKALGSFDISSKDEYAIKVERASLKAYKEQLENMPSAEPEHKTGHWLKISPAGIYECSECGKNVMTADIDAYEFCHGCGCRMMEVEHEKKT